MFRFQSFKMRVQVIQGFVLHIVVEVDRALRVLGGANLS